MSKTVIYHNPRCTKSRQALKLLEEKNENPDTVLYLDTPPSVDELTDIIQMLGIKPYDLLRRGEDIFKENFKGKDLSDKEWIEAMVQFPKLIERPIIVKNKKAVIGRPVEKVLDIL